MSGDATTPGGSSALAPSTRRAYVYPGSGSEALRKHLLAHLAALAALRLCLAEERGQLLVALSSGVLDVLLEAQRIRERLLGEPDQVVVLVLRAGDVAGLFRGCHAVPSSGCLRARYPGCSAVTARCMGPLARRLSYYRHEDSARGFPRRAARGAGGRLCRRAAGDGTRRQLGRAICRWRLSLRHVRGRAQHRGGAHSRRRR